MAIKKFGPNDWGVDIRYKNWNGERDRKRKKGFRTKHEAEAYAREFLNKLERSSDISFNNLVEHYLDDVNTRLKVTTYMNKKFLIESKMLPYFKNIPIGDIDELAVRTWQNALINDPKKYKETYLRQIHNLFSTILNYAVRFYKLKSNVARECGSMGKKNADEMLFWTIKEFNQFIAAIPEDSVYRTVFYLMYYSGIREGELLAITYNDFDFENNIININKTYAKINGVELIQSPKTNKSIREIDMPSQIMDMAKEYHDSFYKYPPTERLFRELTKKKLLYAIKKYSDVAGVKKIRVHDIRHSHAALLMKMRIPILMVSKRLGHENPETTLKTYGHLYPDDGEELMQQMSEKITL